jgi:hypothetical protein
MPRALATQAFLLLLLTAGTTAAAVVAASPAKHGAAKPPVTTTVQTTTTTPPVTTTTTMTTTATTTTTRTTTTAAPPGLTAWPAAGSGYTDVLESIPLASGRAFAVARALDARRQGLPQVGVLVSSDYGSLHAGYYVVFSGIYPSSSAASAALGGAHSHGFADAYQARVSP